MKRAHKRRRMLIRLAVAGLVILGKWYLERERHKWILADCSRSQTGALPWTAVDWS